MPAGTHCAVNDLLGHNAQQATGLEEAVQAIELKARVVQVLDDFRGRNEVIAPGEYGGKMRVKAVIKGDVVAGFRQHDRKGWAGSRTEIKPLAPGAQAFPQRKKQSAQELSVAWIVRPVLVSIILGFFFFSANIVFRRHEHQPADPAAVIVPLPVLVEGIGLNTAA